MTENVGDMEQSSLEAAGYCLLGLIGRQIRHSSSLTKHTVSEVHALFTQSELQSVIAAIPRKQYSTWLVLMGRELRSLAGHVEFAKRLFETVASNEFTTLQDLASERGSQNETAL